MCELFGFTSNQKMDLRPYLRVFYQHSIQHPHGWGLFYPLNNTFYVYKEPVRAIDSPKMFESVENLKKQSVLLAHIRLASVGNRNQLNSHPFINCDTTGREWVQIHNGTIFQDELLEQYKKEQKGSTDSERILFYLMDLINKIDPKTEMERISVVEKMLMNITYGNNKVNYMLYDGDLLYVHTNLKDTLYYIEKENGVLFATTPLSDEEWKKVPLCTLFVYKNGKCIYSSQNHTSEYHL